MAADLSILGLRIYGDSGPKVNAFAIKALWGTAAEILGEWGFEQRTVDCHPVSCKNTGGRPRGATVRAENDRY